MAVLSVMYMRIFLPDSIIDDNVSAPLLSDEKLKVSNSDENSNAEMQSSKALPSIPDLIALLKTRSVNFPAFNSQHRYSLLQLNARNSISFSLLICSPTISQAAIVAFFSSLADVGLHASILVSLNYLLQF